MEGSAINQQFELTLKMTHAERCQMKELIRDGIKAQPTYGSTRTLGIRILELLSIDGEEV